MHKDFYMSKINLFFKKMFCDEILFVNPPREWWITYKDVGRVHEGYIVSAVYKYRGATDIYFDIDNGHLQLISPERAFKNAHKFYMQACKKIQSRYENTK